VRRIRETPKENKPLENKLGHDLTGQQATPASA